MGGVQREKTCDSVGDGRWSFSRSRKICDTLGEAVAMRPARRHTNRYADKQTNSYAWPLCKAPAAGEGA